MSAEQIRQAAETLRKRAAAAHAGPWEAYPDGLVWDTVHRPGDPVSGSTELDDADYIATMYPGVGTALADWLQRTADEFGDTTPWDDPYLSPALLIATLINKQAE